MRAKNLLICGLAVVVAAFHGCGRNASGVGQSTVTVSGVGTVEVVPDIVRMSVTVNKIEQTTRSAQDAVGAMVVRVLAILKDFGIEDKDIMTASLRFNPEYEWRGGRNILIGQRAEQSINFAIRDLGQDNEKAGRIIDRLVEIDGIVLNNIYFSVDDNTEHFVRSRALAFEKARQKAEQYASLAGLKVGKVLNLSEEGSVSPTPAYNYLMSNQFKEEASADAAPSALPSGQTEITTRISVVFLLK